MKSLDIVSITNILLVLQKMELVLVVVFVPLRIVMKYSMRRETPNLRIEGIHSMNIITKLSGNGHLCRSRRCWFTSIVFEENTPDLV